MIVSYLWQDEIYSSSEYNKILLIMIDMYIGVDDIWLELANFILVFWDLAKCRWQLAGNELFLSVIGWYLQ